MKIAMMARNPNLYSHQRLVEAAKERGHEIDIIDTLRVYINIDRIFIALIEEREEVLSPIDWRFLQHPE